MHRTESRRWVVAPPLCLTVVALASAALFVGGCDFRTLTYFLMPEQRLDAKIKHLPSNESKKEPRVVILTWAGLETRREFINADRQIAELLSKKISEVSKQCDEKISFVPTRKVEEFKNSNPRWRSMDLAEVGRKFAADYVIYLEINSLSLYVPGSYNQQMQGRANITIQLCDVNDPDNSPGQEMFAYMYPNDARGSVSVGPDSPPFQFRQDFLDRLAHEMSHYFTRYPPSERRRMD